MQANTRLASTLGYEYYAVTTVRVDLEKKGDIPLRNGKPQKPPPDRYIRAGTYDDALAAKVRGAALSRAQTSSDRSRKARQLEDRVRELRLAGLTNQQITEDRGIMQITEGRGITPRQIQIVCRRLGLPPRPSGRPPNK